MLKEPCALELKLLESSDECKKCGCLASTHKNWAGRAHTDRGGVDMSLSAIADRDNTTKDVFALNRGLAPGGKNTPVASALAPTEAQEDIPFDPPLDKVRANYIVERRDGVRLRFKDIDQVGIYHGELTLSRCIEPIYQKTIRVFAQGEWKNVWDEAEGEGVSVDV